MSERSEKAYNEARIEILKQGLAGRRQDLLVGRYITDKDDLDALAKELAQRKWRGQPVTDPELKDAVKKADTAAADIHSTIEEQENTGTGFLGGATWGQVWSAFSANPGGFIGAFFTALLEGIQGLFQGKGFEGFADAFKKNLGPLVAPAVADDMGSSLRKRLAADGFTETETAQIARAFENTVRQEAHAERLPDIPAATETPEQRAVRLKGDIEKQITPVMQAQQAQLAMAAELPSGTSFTEKQSGAQIKTITDTLYNVATDPNTIAVTGEDDKRDQPTRIRDYIQKQLGDHKNEMGFGGISDKAREATFKNMANVITEKYLKSGPLDVETGTKFAAEHANENEGCTRIIIEEQVNKQWDNRINSDQKTKAAFDAVFSGDKQNHIKRDIVNALVTAQKDNDFNNPDKRWSLIFMAVSKELKNSLPGNTNISVPPSADGWWSGVDMVARGSIKPGDARDTIATLIADQMTGKPAKSEAEIKAALKPATEFKSPIEIGISAIVPFILPVAKFLGK